MEGMAVRPLQGRWDRRGRFPRAPRPKASGRHGTQDKKKTLGGEGCESFFQTRFGTKAV